MRSDSFSGQDDVNSFFNTDYEEIAPQSGLVGAAVIAAVDSRQPSQPEQPEAETASELKPQQSTASSEQFEIGNYSFDEEEGEEEEEEYDSFYDGFGPSL